MASVEDLPYHHSYICIKTEMKVHETIRPSMSARPSSSSSSSSSRSSSSIVALVVVVAVVSVNQSINLSIYLSIYLSASMKSKLFCEIPLILNLTFKHAGFLRDFLKKNWKLDNVRNETILRDFLIFRNWQHQKRSNSARRPSKMESWVQSRPRTNAFCDFSTPLV